MRLAVIIVNYRTSDLVQACLASLSTEIDPACDRVTVVDNGSADGSAERLAHAIDAARWTWVRVERLPVNGGFAAGVNHALRATPADACVLLNSDTVVRPGALAALRAALAADPRAGVIGACIASDDGTEQASAFRFPSPLGELVRAAASGPVTRVLARWTVAGPEGRGVQDPEWVSFAAVALRAVLVAQVGLLDEGYFLFFEDVDYCRRAREAGWRITRCPDAHVIHSYAGGSLADRSARGATRRAHFYAARARYYRRFHGRHGLLAANLSWTVGRSISLARQLVSGWAPGLPPGEGRAIWTRAVRSPGPLEER